MITDIENLVTKINEGGANLIAGQQQFSYENRI